MIVQPCRASVELSVPGADKTKAVEVVLGQAVTDVNHPDEVVVQHLLVDGAEIPNPLRGLVVVDLGGIGPPKLLEVAIDHSKSRVDSSLQQTGRAIYSTGVEPSAR